MKKLINSPYFPKHIESFRIPGGESFLIMECCKESLKDFSRNQPDRILSLKQTSIVMQQAVEALRFMHESGYVHRDIKAINIMMSKSTPDEITIKVIDFGLARRILNEDGSLREKRSDGKVSFRGTKLYCSLNQLLKRVISSYLYIEPFFPI